MSEWCAFVPSSEYKSTFWVHDRTIHAIHHSGSISKGTVTSIRVSTMDAHQQWWQHYYSSAAPSAGYGPLTNAVRHHYRHPYHAHTASTTENNTAPPAPLPTTFPPEPLPPPPPAAHTNTTSHLSVLPPNTPKIPNTWTQSDTHQDTNTVHGQTLFRTIMLTS